MQNTEDIILMSSINYTSRVLSETAIGEETEREDNAQQLFVTVGSASVGAVVIPVLLTVLILTMYYLCIVKYKMCTPIHDPTQVERSYHEEEPETNVTAESVGTVEEATCYINSELISPSPPSYDEGSQYPFLSISLPSYENIFYLSEAVNSNSGSSQITANPRTSFKPSGRGRFVFVISNNDTAVTESEGDADQLDHSPDDQLTELQVVDSVTSYYFRLHDNSDREEITSD